MKFAVFVIDNFWTLLLFAIIAGVLLDFFVGDSVAGITFLLALIVGLAGLASSSYIKETEKVAELAQQKEQLKHCVKFADRDAQSIFEYPQEGYRCPATDGQPAVERWINK